MSGVTVIILTAIGGGIVLLVIRAVVSLWRRGEAVEIELDEIEKLFSTPASVD